MRKDGRKLDHQTLEAIRMMAVERVREGEAPSAVIQSYGFCRTTIYKWLSKIDRAKNDPSVLVSRPATGRPRRLTTRQEQQILNGSMAKTRVNTDLISVSGRAGL